MYITEGQYELLPLKNGFIHEICRMLFKHFGDDTSSGQTNLPVPVFNPNAKNPKIFYFEVQILMSIYYKSIYIGFCGENFSLNHYLLGKQENSIRIEYTNEMLIQKNNSRYDYGDFLKGDMVGVGIIHWPNSKIECFATSNGELLGKAELPAKFADVELFPVISVDSLCYAQSIRAVGMDEWRFKEFKNALQLNTAKMTKWIEICCA